VKIAHEYSGPVVHVHDASGAVDVVSSLLGGKLEDYARRRKEALEVAERWLASNLAYEATEFGVKC
jgi:cobalamin-dependent methionine synthase I